GVQARGDAWLRQAAPDRVGDARLRAARLCARLRAARARPGAVDMDRQRDRGAWSRQGDLVGGAVADTRRRTAARVRRDPLPRAERRASALEVPELRRGPRRRPLADRLG